MRSEQGQWWPVLNGKPLWAPAGQGMTNGRTVMAKVDVMGRIDPTRDAIAGQWRATEAGLEVKDTYIAQILLPVPLEKNYQLDVDVTRVRGHDFGFIIPVGLRHCMILLGAWHGTASGIDWVDGRSANDNITTVRPGTFENGRRYSFHIRVSLDDCDQTCAIAVDLDGKPYIEYRGAVARLFMPPHDWEEPKAGCAVAFRLPGHRCDLPPCQGRPGSRTSRTTRKPRFRSGTSRGPRTIGQPAAEGGEFCGPEPAVSRQLQENGRTPRGSGA